MSHLTADQLVEIAMGPLPAADNSAALDHLSECVTCRAEVVRLEQLARDFAILRRSEPAPEALDRYASYFTHVEVRPSTVRRMVAALAAILQWDSRQQPMLQGVRSGGAVAYRQLFTTDHVEMELLVEPQQQHFRLQGEIMTLEASDQLGRVLIQLVDAAGMIREQEAGGDGRFHFEEAPGGMYRLLVSSLSADILEIEALEIG